MGMLSKLIIQVVLFVFTFLITECMTVQQVRGKEDINVIDMPIISTSTRAVSDYHVEVSCSDTKPRTAVARLTWAANKRSFDKQRLDVTIYKGGFEKNLFTILYPLQKGQKFQTSSFAKLSDRSSNKSLYLNCERINVDKRNGSATIEIEGLEPGLNYYMRVLNLNKRGWVPGGTVRFEVPICPADMIEEDVN